MLNFIYWPISAIMWFWREALSMVMDPHAGVTWLLSIVLLTWTIKALLVWPTVKQIRSGQKTAKLAPQMKAIRERYKNDQAKMAEETQKLYKTAGVNPLAGCIPMLVQIPVFIGLFHVLRSFNRTGDGFGGLGLTNEENRSIGNYMFSPEDVQSFLDARVFGVPLSASISMPAEQYEAFQPVDFGRFDIILVAVPMVLLVATLTHLTARYSLGRQQARQAAGKTNAPAGDNAEMMEMQQQMMGKMMLWVMPAITIFTGFIWTIGLLVYMSSNVLWSYVQTRLVYRMIDREEAAEEAEKEELRRANAPVVGARKVEKKSKKERTEDNLAREQAARDAAQARQQAQNARAQSGKKKKKKG
ncbi:inner membrane protein translocase component YidC [Corynebacterium maris DSM 45190]|uniref:Membrane protein insertase YidC n=1 Tax=Corynebacterium maris DSM 45190 TaxID=1224163 RepID=S5T5Z0_9CORY|nr:membrane protein insertase YidC [Corynebacterium maris]AGS36025.1 inner membrane protein translocase component YidC [Corynebacterium maris DSM 45190]